MIYVGPRASRNAVVRGLVGLFSILCLNPLALAQEGSEEAADAVVEAVAEDVAEDVTLSTGPAATIEAFNAAIITAIQTPEEEGFAVRHDIMKQAVTDAFDLPTMARRTINRLIWSDWTKEQKQTYIATLLVFQSAVLADRFKPGAEVSFVVDAVEDGRRKTKLVKTRILRPDDDDVKLNYLTVERADKWRVVDIYLNSTISEVALRRSEYSNIVTNQGFEALLEALQQQIDDVIADNAPPEI